jgi:hypothetical protein
VSDSNEVVDQAEAAPVAGTAPSGEAPKKKKKGLPGWVSLVVIVICLGVVGAVYSNLLKEPPAIHLKNLRLTRGDNKAG